MIDIALLDRLIADLTELRAALETDRPQVEPEFAPGETLIDTATASERFNLPPDTCRWLAREKGLGEKIGGRWMLDAAALRKYRSDA
ncbi:hypothetical protein [Consotaella salsifontis]|uniref:Helix-turn-helix domain-containing protein n=1 Tax=Consotaella salsifontis TaxID=1365950 RepID=A0A1T4R573_9HYPH|nr:hypothetical protein [Consotaella salsifontis]SKA11025.1 hypothetical protein SAMN05428963_10628 [Consotaella salsifontis]